MLLVAAMLLPSFTALPALAAEPVADDPGEIVSPGDFPISVFNTPGHTSGSLRVTWDGPSGDWAYRYYQRPAGTEDWEERSTKYGQTIQVLNITPRAGERYLHYWLQTFQREAKTDGIELTTVSQAEFEARPDTYLKDESGKYKYDVVVIGFADLNRETRNLDNSVAAIDALIRAGRGVLFGHDTLFDADPLGDTNLATLAGRFGANWAYSSASPGGAEKGWFNTHGGSREVWIAGNWAYSRLAHHVGVIPGVSEDGSYWTARFGSRGTENSTAWTTARIQYSAGTGTTAQWQNDAPVSYVRVTDGGFLTTYPNDLPEDTVLTVPMSHVNGTAASGREWMTYVQDGEGTPFPEGDVGSRFHHHHTYTYGGTAYRDSGYLVSYKNAALIQTGHDSGRATVDEVAVLVNTMYHLAQLTEATELDDASALDTAAPDSPVAKLTGLDGGRARIGIHADDRGTAYEVYVEALEQSGTGETLASDVVRQTSATGTARYYYLISDRERVSLADLTGEIPHVWGEGAALELDPVEDGDKYLHLAACDHAGNMSEISTYPVAGFKPTIRVKVTDGQGTGVPGATVVALGETGQADGEGGLLLYPDGTGTYTVAACAEGYGMAAVTVEVTAEEFVVEAPIALPSPGDGSIYGYVLDEGDHAPLAGATVRTVTGAGAETDDYGFYVISHLTSGQYTLTAGATGYNTGFTPVTVPETQVEQSFLLTKQDGHNNRYILTGLVTGGGAALSGASVAHEAATVYTDSFGGYAIGSFSPGTELFAYAMDDYVPSPATPVTFDGGDVRLDVDLEPLNGMGRVLVRVLDGSGAPVAGADVLLGGDEAATDGQGEAAFTLPHGTHALMAVRDGFDAFSGQVTVDSAHQVVEITLTEGEGGGIYGRVVDAETLLGIGGARVKTVNPGGGRTRADDRGYYVLAPLDPGVYAVVAHAGGYAPAADNLTVTPGGGSGKDFYLNRADGTYYIHGQVRGEMDGSPVAGATVTDAESGRSTVADGGGYYALTGYPDGSTAEISAALGEAGSGTATVHIQGAPAEKNLVLRSALTVEVRYVDEGTGEILFRYDIPTSRGGAPFQVSAGPLPHYRPVSEGAIQVDPATVPLDENNRHVVSFLYRYNMVEVTIQGLLPDGTPIDRFTPFTVLAELDQPFDYAKQIGVSGHTLSHRDRPLVPTADGDNRFSLYYLQDTGSMAVQAVDLSDGGKLLGTVHTPIARDEPYLITGENGPGTEDIPALAFYTLDLTESYVGTPGEAAYTFPGDGTAVPAAVYAYTRNETPVGIVLRAAETGAVLAETRVSAPQGQTFAYTPAQARALLRAQASTPEDYTLVTTVDQKVYIPAGSTGETLTFFFLTGGDNTPPPVDTVQVTVRGVDEAENTLYTHTSTYRPGSVVTAEADTVEGYTLDDEATKTITASTDEAYNQITFRYRANETAPPPETHRAYMEGYEDGTFRPTGSLTRAETAMLFYRLLEHDHKGAPQPNPYTDVPTDQWYTQAVLYLSGAGILEGYEDNTFRPGAPVTRAEMSAICSRLYGLEEPGAVRIFPDVTESHWALHDIESAYTKGWIEGYEDGHFRPDRSILRAEAATLINRMLNRQIHPEDIPDGARGYSDVPESYWGHAAISEASNAHLCARHDDGYELWLTA